MARKLFFILIFNLLPSIVACTNTEPTPQLTLVATKSVVTVMMTATTIPSTGTFTPSATPQPTAKSTAILTVTVLPTTTPAPSVTPPSTQVIQNSGITTTEGIGLEIINQIGGAVTAVAVQDNLAYLGIGARLAVADISNPANPYVVSWSEILPGIVRQITWHNGLAYVAMGEAGFWVFDVSDPVAFQPLGQVQTTNPAEHFLLQEDLAYVVSTSGEPNTNQVISIVDVSDPAQPLEISTLPLPFQAAKLALVDGYLYVSLYPRYAGYEDAFWVLDVTNPTQPVIITDIPELAGRDMVLIDQGLVIAQGGSLTLADVSDPTHPYKVVKSPYLLDYAAINALIRSGDALFALTLHGDIGYCGGEIYAFDISPMDAVERLDSVGTDCGVYDMAVVDGLLYLATDHGLVIVDVRNPRAMTKMGELATLPPLEKIEAGDYLFGLGRAGNRYQIFTFAVDDPERPLLLSQFGVDYLINDFVAGGAYAYLATYWDGLAAVDMTNPVAPSIMAVNSLQRPVENSYNLVLSENRLYASLNGNLGIFDPVTLEQLGGDGAELYGPYSSFAVAENTLWTWESAANGLQAVDITDPEQVEPIAFTNQVAQGSRTRFLVDQDFLYIINGSNCDYGYGITCEEETLIIMEIPGQMKVVTFGASDLARFSRHLSKPF